MFYDSRYRSLVVIIMAVFVGVSASLSQDASISSRWDANVSAIQWRPAAEQVRPAELPRRLVRFDGPSPHEEPAEAPPVCRRDKTDAGVAFEIDGQVSERRTMIWSAPVEGPPSPGTHDYYSFRYRARGILRSNPPTVVLGAIGKDAEGKAASAPLITADQILNDNRWHTVVGKKSISFLIDRLQVQVSTTDSVGRFEIDCLAFHDAPPAVEVQLTGSVPRKIDSNTRLECVDLGDLPNDTCEASFRRLLDTFGMAVDGGAWPNASSGIPLKITGERADLIRPKENPGLDAAPVDLLGTKTTRHYFKPRGRGDLITVPIGKRASEVFFVMAAELPPRESCYVRPAWPRPVDDVESLVVELQYGDGERDFAFPYSMADGGFMVRRALGAYAVPADPERELARFVLHNRVPGKTFSLGAMTVNTSPVRVVPEMSPDGAPVHVSQRPQPGQRPATVRRDGDRIVLSNTFFEMVVNCRKGFSIESLRQRFSDTAMCLAPSSGLELELGDTILTGRAFRTESIQVDASSATIGLKSLVPAIPARLTVRISVDDSPQVAMNLTVENAGESPLEPTVRFPVLRAMTIGEGDDTWLFFPQYRNVITNRCGAYVAPNDHCFPMQVCDVYNPQAGVGLALLTHNLDQRSLDYGMAKDDRGVSAFVQAPGEFCRIAPGKSIVHVESCLVFHSGDWRGAIEAYRRWLAEVLVASTSQDEDWFLGTFLLRNHQAKKLYSWAVSIFDPEKNAYRIDDFVRVDTDYLGMCPQVYHLFAWTDLKNGWQGHPNGDYRAESITGGPEALKTAVSRLQDDHGIAASLYTISDRCLKNSEFGRQHGRQCAIRRKDGSLAEDEFNWYLCGNTQQWRDQYVESLCRTQRETGVKMLYVDVFPFFRSSACYSSDHGHEVPSQVNRGTQALIRQLRQRLPDDVVLWSEYPLPDTSQSFIDGNIHYYCLDWHTHFGKTYDQLETAPPVAEVPHNLYRFVFPNLKQFIFPCGVSPYSGDTKFPFFNGEALYDCGWSLYAGDNLERIKKSLAIQREYADCFASPNPVPEVEALQREVHANCFPGQGRTVWTLFNARYTTVRGAVLAVEHRPGATYHDVWNDLALEPELVDGQAILSLTLHPQQIGCVVQAWNSD